MHFTRTGASGVSLPETTRSGEVVFSVVGAVGAAAAALEEERRRRLNEE